MQGSLHLENGVLYVGAHELTAHVRAYDLDGRRLEAGFSFRAPGGGRSSVDGLALDRDHRLWIADGAARRLRAFTLFGSEVAGVTAEPGLEEDRAGELGAPSDVLSLGSDEEHRLVVASAGRRRHAVQVLSLGAGRTLSLRPLGDPAGEFAGVCDLALRPAPVEGEPGALLYACERLAGRIQVFRDLEFHFALHVPVRGARFDPRAAAPLEGGRLVVCQGGPASALLVVDAGGRVLRQLAGPGTDEGQVQEPNDVVVEPGRDDAHTRVLVVDREGTRVQVFTAGGACYGAFPERLELSR